MDESRRIMRLHIEGNWSANEMGQMFLALSDLYNLRLVLQVHFEEMLEWERYYFERGRLVSPRRYRQFSRFRWDFPPPIFFDNASLDRLGELVDLNERIQVRRINFASPGLSDLAGIGAIIGHIKDFVLALLDRHDSKRQRELADEEKELEVEAKRIENAKKLIDLANQIGCTPMEMRRLIAYADERQEPLIQLIDQQKLVGVSEADHPTDDSRML